jgi:hypothetical protein
LSPGLQSTSKAKNYSTDQYGPSTAEPITHEASGSGAEESPSSEDRHDCAGFIIFWLEFGDESLRFDDLCNDTQVISV